MKKKLKSEKTNTKEKEKKSSDDDLHRFGSFLWFSLIIWFTQIGHKSLQMHFGNGFHVLITRWMRVDASLWVGMSVQVRLLTAGSLQTPWKRDPHWPVLLLLLLLLDASWLTPWVFIRFWHVLTGELALSLVGVP